MGSLLTVTCRSCGSESRQVDGPIMTGFNPRCDRCGATAFVSIADLYASDPPGMDEASDSAWQLRDERLSTLAGPCSCGGSFVEDAPVRCPACRSTDVAPRVDGMLD
jgi:hypothetical protein